MSGVPPSDMNDASGRLQRCIRDLAALNALPSMCVGRSPDEALDIVLDALPTALTCDLVYLEVPGAPPKERISLLGGPVRDALFAEVRAALATALDRAAVLVIPSAGQLWCCEAALPVGAERGRLVVGRATPFDSDTDRVLVRSAANLVGTTLETANVLEAERRKDEFLAMLGHELRNPLAPIVTAVELLAMHPAVARERHVIERNTRHLARLVDDLLDISRITLGNIELRSEQVPLASVLERAAEMAMPLISQHGHALRVADAEGVALQGDPVRLAQIFGNLLTNAAKFTPPGGNIEVAVEHAPAAVRVSVRDDGRGIAPEKLKRIFDPFVQVERKRDALGGGLGLGLAIVKNLVERHGGSITAHSEGPERGCTFVVQLPTVTPARDRAEKPRSRAVTARSCVRVLVVDDNVDIASLLSEALGLAGFEIAVEHDGHAALNRWRSFVPHAAILDVGLPDLDGYELARRLRAEHGSTPLLIAATGYGQQRDRELATEAGFDCHFIKPVSVQELLAVLDQRVVMAASAAADA
ncbi:MAG TPA: hybrid sensor histidine kinase/response regulator [Polyangiaceae bacterium]|nr:hybrid sensor histidine kinase/response regulator [Polyangiaceae bacterium]